MKIKQLIEEASLKDDDFKNRINYWINRKKRAPEHTWLFRHLERILGTDYVRKAAQEEVDSRTTIATK